MKKIFYILFLVGYLSGDDFLTNVEYAKKLYHNPRGISCAQCHGEKGEGSTLSAYVIELNGKRKLRDITAPRINNIKMLDFLKAFEKKRSYMPTYYLTDRELAYIYFYITRFGPKPKKDAKKQDTKEIKNKSNVDENKTKVVKDANLTSKVEKKNIIKKDSNTTKKETTKDINTTKKSKDNNETIKE